MSHNPSPLVATEDERLTILSIEPFQPDSEFSRLMTVNHDNSELPSNYGHNPITQMLDTFERSTVQEKKPFLTIKYRNYLFVMILGTFLICCICFLWSSFISDVWFNIELTLDVQYPVVLQKQIQLTKDNLLSIFKKINDTNHNEVTALVLVTTLLLPCLSVVYIMSQIFHIFKCTSLNDEKTLQSPVSASCKPVELLVRWAYVAVFIQIYIFLLNHFISLHWTNTTATLNTKLSEGYISYVVGVTSALFAIVLLRFLEKKQKHQYQDTKVATCINCDSEASKCKTLAKTDDAHNLMQILEDIPDSIHLSTRLPKQLYDTNTSEFRMNKPPVSFIRTFIAFQSGLLSILLIIPTICLPIIRIQYSGTASELMGSSTYLISICDIPHALISGARSTDTKIWIIWILIIAMFIILVVCPVVANTLAITGWMVPANSLSKNTPSKTFNQKLLYVLHPMIGTPVLTVTLLICVFRMREIVTCISSEHLTHENSVFQMFGFENQARLFQGANLCTKSHVSIESGAIFYFVQSICQETFIALSQPNV